MSVPIKYLVFKGVSKKEEILFKSFLNLAKNELAYKLVVLKANQVDVDDPDIVIIDEHYQPKESERGLFDLPSIIVGDDHQKQTANYISRPVQWSEFKSAFTSLDVSSEESSEPITRILPEGVNFAIADISEKTSDNTDSSADLANSDPKFSDEGEYEYELDKMSIDYHSFTNSDYIKVVDDVKQFKDLPNAQGNVPVILMTDDESASMNSVLVLETNSMDAWDFSHSETSVSEAARQHAQKFEEPVTQEVTLKQRAGFEVKSNEKYWLEDNEIIIDNQSFLFIKPAREMVYSNTEPGKWPAQLQRRVLFKVPLPDDWRPENGMAVYPLSSLLWVNTLINDTNKLASGLDEGADYLLEKWPSFDLLELDNVLLKLCTMLFVRPESVASLAAKSGYARSTIRGLMNACYRLGYLITPDQLDTQQMVQVDNDEGMLGKIKDVFR